MLHSMPTGYQKKGRPNFDDLLKFFSKKHKFLCTGSQSLYLWKGKYWEYTEDAYINGFCEDNMEPKPNNTICNEFRAKVFRNNLVEENWFNDTTFRKLNLNNCIIDLDNGEHKILEHSPKYGFLNVLPYDYDIDADCPRFDKFMEEITMNRRELEDVLLEFAGYSFSNGECTTGKALILLGEGANGKSTFLNILKRLAGKNGYSSISIGKLNNEQYLAQLQGKLFNVMEETPKKAFFDSSEFKNLTTGGDIMAKIVYKQPYLVANRAKLILCCNNMPPSSDSSKGMLRRMLIVPFDKTFEDHEQDIRIEQKLIKESSGILNRIIDSYLRFEKKGFTRSDAINEEVQMYKEDIDPIYNFVKDKIEVVDNENGTTPMKDIYEAYREHALSCGVRSFDILPVRQLSTALCRHIPRWRDRKKLKDSGRMVVYVGVKLLNESHDY